MHHANITVFQINGYTLWSHLLVICMPVHTTDITWGQKQKITNKKPEFPLEHTQPSQYLVYIHLSPFSQHYVELFPY